jgi:hypothetical protein
MSVLRCETNGSDVLVVLFVKPTVQQRVVKQTM